MQIVVLRGTTSVAIMRPTGCRSATGRLRRGNGRRPTRSATSMRRPHEPRNLGALRRRGASEAPADALEGPVAGAGPPTRGYAACGITTGGTLGKTWTKTKADRCLRRPSIRQNYVARPGAGRAQVDRAVDPERRCSSVSAGAAWASAWRTSCRRGGPRRASPGRLRTAAEKVGPAARRGVTDRHGLDLGDELRQRHASLPLPIAAQGRRDGPFRKLG